MRTTFLLPLLAALFTFAGMPAQTFVLLTRVGPGDLQLNAELVAAIANEPQVEAAVRAEAGALMKAWNGVGTRIYGSHAAGTFQLHFTINTLMTDEPGAAKNAAIVDAARKHIEQRIEYLFHDQPVQRLTKRRAQLTERLSVLMAKQAQCAELADSVDSAAARLQRASDLLEEQFAETRLALATEQRAHDHLETMRQEYHAQRDSLRQEGEHAEQQSIALSIGLRDLQISLQKAKPTELQAKRIELDTMTDKIAQLEAKRRHVAASEIDVQQMLASALEKLPTSSLALQRSRARLDSLVSARRAHQDRSKQAAQERTNSFSARVDNASLTIEITVCKELLAEVQGKLARLEPVRFEVLRPQ